MRKVRFLLSSLDLLKKKSLKDVPLMAPEFPSLVGGGDVCLREIESIHRIYAECLAEDNLRANLVEEICTVIEEVPCLPKKWGCVPSRNEEESFRNENKDKMKGNGFVGSARVSSEPGRCIESQKKDWRNI